jgi:hypothetical protein
MPCDNLDIVLKSVSDEYVVEAVEPIERFLECTAAAP